MTYVFERLNTSTNGPTVPKPVMASPSLGSRSTAQPLPAPPPVDQFRGSPIADANTRLGFDEDPATMTRLPTNSMNRPFGTAPDDADQSAMFPAPVHCF